jgi:hypothetical protein
VITERDYTALGRHDLIDLARSLEARASESEANERRWLARIKELEARAERARVQLSGGGQ